MNPPAEPTLHPVRFSKLLSVVGPTAVGKTELSLKLAQHFGGEIISADSRLFYRGMDIGTAKPSHAERASIPHHLIDICEPDETLTLAQFQRFVYATIDDVLARGRLPILTGGTGQYVMAIVEGWGIPEVAPQSDLRTELERLESEELRRWLSKIDPAAAAKIEGPNRRRLIRAIEVALVLGQPISDVQTKQPPPYDILMVGINREREELYARIDTRVDQMMQDGLLDEVRSLVALGFERDLPSMSGLGYRQLTAVLEHELTVDEAIERIKFETHRFARQQANWFRKKDARIHWFEAGDVDERARLLAVVTAWLEK